MKYRSIGITVLILGLVACSDGEDKFNPDVNPLSELAYQHQYTIISHLIECIDWTKATYRTREKQFSKRVNDMCHRKYRELSEVTESEFGFKFTPNLLPDQEWIEKQMKVIDEKRDECMGKIKIKKFVCFSGKLNSLRQKARY